MLVIKHYYKFELEKEYYCRTEEKAFEIVKKIIEKIENLIPIGMMSNLTSIFSKTLNNYVNIFLTKE